MESDDSALRAPPVTASDLPVRKYHTARHASFREPVQRHPQIGPPHAAPSANEPPIQQRILSLHPQCDAPSAASLGEVAQRLDHPVEVALVLDGELEDPQLLARPAL